MAMMLATLATMLPMYRYIILPDQTTTNICKGATYLHLKVSEAICRKIFKHVKRYCVFS
jgi:hypothetical protein